MSDVVGSTHPGTRAMVLVVEVSWSSAHQDHVSTAARGDRLAVPGTDLTIDVAELLGP